MAKKEKNKDVVSDYRNALTKRMDNFNDEHRFRAAKVASWIQSEEDLDEEVAETIYTKLLYEIINDSDPMDISAYEYLMGIVSSKKVRDTSDLTNMRRYQKTIVDLLRRHEQEYVMSLLMIVANNYSSDTLIKFNAFVEAMAAEDKKKLKSVNNTTQIGKKRK